MPANPAEPETQTEAIEKQGHFGQLVSCAIRVPGLTLRAFLGHSRGMARFMWQTDNAVVAGANVAAELPIWGADRFQAVQRSAALLFQDWIADNQDTPEARPRLFGGFAFQDNFVPDNTWSIYAPAIFVLPHYQFAQIGTDTPWLILNVLISAGEDVAETMVSLREALVQQAAVLLAQPETLVSSRETAHQQPTQINYPMPFSAWQQAIEQARLAIHSGDLVKVVLARAFELRFAQNISVDSALDFLASEYANCYRFLFEPRPYHAFLGATPELLASVEGQHLYSMALAGSIRRGKTPDEDCQLTEKLLSDPKERLEHQIVVQALRDTLTPLTSNLVIPDAPAILSLKNIQHLHTAVRGTLKARSGVLPLVQALHPTPALGGTPREAAMKFISIAEPVPRGWYAAPIGWLGPDLDGEFGIAIRSAVSEGRRVWLYAGAGIVESSQPQKEWDETALKFRPMLNAFGLTDLEELA